MRRRIRDRFKNMAKGQTRGIDQGSGSLDEGKAVLEVIGIIEFQSVGTDRLDLLKGASGPLAVRLAQPEQGSRPWDGMLPDPHRMGRIK